ncbi:MULTISPECIES: metal-dependent hydrolase family protein [Brucella/Ochrobactrum group]|uniref:Prolidase n=1 Tax=Ochrobactrum soli TaxID=2448455 RepID=A0A2P9HFH7_9HYPH|nr:MULTISPECIES: amidohydrolase family protein [Brucella]MCI0998896.1 amidohydrolase family protein [Ochrobactrum sp. C6C9]RRD26962.1 amidohydrolase family protein [Brucellaceae bacterium VT-16-1752]WHT43506.1 amidohydrolase family protein [Ochrobactrum sp. SSR]MDX4075154.1 amidohydrolase family protein [Brucella sp. NBRC 113783]RLL73789.1 amidohydrolase family protein [[Ochrobactrum] soli]
MFRLGQKYQSFVHGSGCSCFSPSLQQVSRRLDSFSRRSFLAGLGATAIAAAAPKKLHAQTAGPSAKTLFRQVSLFDGKSDSLRADVQILVEGNKIVAVDTTNSAPPEGATVVNCGGRVLMPGLIDAHWHTLYAAVPLNVLLTGDPAGIFASSTAEAERTLERGFTTVRDMGGPVFTFKQAIDNGIIPGPRIYPSGAMITTTGGHGDLRMPFEVPRGGNELSLGEKIGGAAIVDDAGSLKMRVREQLMQGASQVKLVGGGGVSTPRSPLDMSTFDENEIRAANDVARDWNTYMTVHAYAPHTVQRSLNVGVGCIEHAHLMDDETARMFVDKNVWLSTQPFLSMDDTGTLTGPSAERAQQLFAATPRMYELIRKHGVKTAWGSDILFSPQLAPRQSFMLTHLSQWYSNAEALRMATSGNAELLTLSNLRNPYPGKLGVIEKDALADLLVVNTNPLEDIHALEKPAESLAVIMKDGRMQKNTL